MMWDVINSTQFINSISPIARRYGYFVCLYGSVLYKGQSNKDLDLQIISFVGDDNHRKLLSDICNRIGCEEIGEPYLGLQNTYSVILKLPSNQIVDMVIRLNKVNNNIYDPPTT
jgi:hypothetical protein